MESHLDDDLAGRSAEDLAEEVRRLRAGIREHRDSTGHDLCWHHPALWGLLPERVAPDLRVPAWGEFLQRCVAYRRSLDLPPPEPGEGGRNEDAASFE